MSETLGKRLQLLANRLLHPVGLHIMRSRQAFGMEELLGHAALRGVDPQTVIDVGASNGVWSLGARRHFQQARFVLFEPLAEQAAALDRLRRTHAFDIVPAAAGAARGACSLNVGDDLDGSSVTTAPQAGARTVPVESIDDIVSARNASGPYLIKLDTHGYEIPVLEGAARTLAQTELLIIESYNFQITENCLRFHQLCAWLEQRGFRCCDLADPMRRPGDGVLWQMDLAFAPVSSPLFSTNSYR